MDQDGQMVALRGLSVLKGIPDSKRDEICEVILGVSEAKEFSEGESLMHEGYLAFETGYVLLDGAVRVNREGFGELEVKGPAMLGEMSQFIDGDKRTATVHAKENSNALVFSWDDFHEALKEELSDDVHRMFVNGLERVVWKRFDLDDMLSLPLFHGLDEDLRLRVCLPFPWITERLLVGTDEHLFLEGDRCQAKGFLLTRGSVVVYRSDGSEMKVRAPNILGVIPAPNPDLKWSASAKAREDVEVLRFSWEDYTEKLNERLTKEDKSSLVKSMKTNSSKHFRY